MAIHDLKPENIKVRLIPKFKLKKKGKDDKHKEGQEEPIRKPKQD
jgi:hypothetical protein